MDGRSTGFQYINEGIIIMTPEQAERLLDLLEHQIQILHDIRWYLCCAPEGCQSTCHCPGCKREESQKGKEGE